MMICNSEYHTGICPAKTKDGRCKSEFPCRHKVSPPKPQTNADRIRAMTDEELAVMFAKLRADLPRLDRMVQPYSGKDVNDNYDWLQQSYGGADHE